MDISNHTVDELRQLKKDIDIELEKRTQMPVCRCYVVRLNRSESGAEYFKRYEDAKAEFLNEVDFTVQETENKYSLEPIDIPETDYRLRPDHWFA